MSDTHPTPTRTVLVSAQSAPERRRVDETGGDPANRLVVFSTDLNEYNDDRYLSTQFGIPLTTTLAFSVPYAADPDVKFAMETNLDLVLTLLSGRVAAFVEVCYVIDCDSWEVNLFSWNGPQFTKNLFHTAQSDLSITPIIGWLVGKYGEP